MPHAELGSTDSGLDGSALSSRSSLEAVDPDTLPKMISLKQTLSLGSSVDEAVADVPFIIHSQCQGWVDAKQELYYDHVMYTAPFVPTLWLPYVCHCT